MAELGDFDLLTLSLDLFKIFASRAFFNILITVVGLPFLLGSFDVSHTLIVVGFSLVLGTSIFFSLFTDALSLSCNFCFLLTLPFSSVTDVSFVSSLSSSLDIDNGR